MKEIKRNLRSMAAQDIRKAHLDEEHQQKLDKELERRVTQQSTSMADFNNGGFFNEKNLMQNDMQNTQKVKLNWHYTTHSLRDIASGSYFPTLVMYITFLINGLLNIILWLLRGNPAFFHTIAVAMDILILLITMFFNKFVASEKFWSDQHHYVYQDLNIIYYNLARLIQGLISGFSENILKVPQIIFYISAGGLIASAILNLLFNITYYLPFLVLYLLYMLLKMSNQQVNQKLSQDRKLILVMMLIISINSIVSPFMFQHFDFVGAITVIILNNLYSLMKHIEIYFPK